MEFQITEAIELVKTLAETENLTHTQALTAFFYEADLGIEDAAALKAAFYEEYTLREMAEDSLSNAFKTVFVTGVEELAEVDTKETGEGTKYKVRVKDRNSQSSYTRYATRQKIAELRANPNIASVELTDYGSTGEDDDGSKTAAAKRGDRDGDGNVESSSKEHAGVVHNAIQRKMGGKPDGQDTRKEEFELEEGKKEADLGKMERQENKHRKASTSQKGGGRGDSKNKSNKMSSIRGAIERGEDPRRDTYAGKRSGKDGTHPPEDHRKAFTRTPLKDRPAKEPGVKKESAWEQYQELRASKKKVDEGYKGKHGQSDEEHMDSRSDAAKQISGDSETSGAEYSHRSYRGVGKPAKPGERQENQGKMTDADRNELAIRKNALKKKTQKEDFLPEADLVDAGRENQGEREGKKLTGKGVDNKSSIKLMPSIDESVVTESEESLAQQRLRNSSSNDSLRGAIRNLVAEECCPKCGTPECTCEGKKEEKPRKKKAKLDEAGMPILEYSRNNARPGPSKEMIDPPADANGPEGHMNPKGEPKRYKEAGEAPGDRRPNRKKDKSLPFDDGTVPNGSGV